MRAILTRSSDEPQPMPTGPNPMLPLEEFTTKEYNLVPVAMAGVYRVEIDRNREVGFFEHQYNGFRGKFWLAGTVLIGSNHLIPCAVRRALEQLTYEVA